VSLECEGVNPQPAAHGAPGRRCPFPGTPTPRGAGKHPPSGRGTPSVLAGRRNSSLCPVSFEKTRISQFAFMRRFHISFQLEGKKREKKHTLFLARLEVV